MIRRYPIVIRNKAISIFKFPAKSRLSFAPACCSVRMGSRHSPDYVAASAVSDRRGLAAAKIADKTSIDLSGKYRLLFIL